MFDIEKARAKGCSEDIIAIMQRVNDNRAKHENCSGHDFIKLSYGKYRCKKCGYEADGSYVVGYRDALKHIRTKKDDEQECVE